jgi:branched-chain amino acid transport system ATP-binding protein
MLEVKDLSVSYGKHIALEGASVRVDKGEIVVILGANGAGKSSLLKAISGVSEGRVSGTVTMDGIDISGRPANRIVEEGIALVPEGRGVFADLTVQENLTLGAYGRRARDEEAANLEQVLTLFPKLRERRRQIVRTMSGGEQQMVAIGRAMMSNPQILTLDEPSLGLSPLLCKDLFQSLKTVRAAGIGILLVEQNAKQSLAIADRGYLLENGRIVHEDRAEKLMTDPAVQKAYLGGGGAAAPMTQRGREGTAAPPVPAPSGPRAPAQSPADIAAAALRPFAGRSAPPAAPAPAAPAPRPAPAPSEHEAARPPTGTASSSDRHGIGIEDLVARASATSAGTVSARRANGAAPSIPTAPRMRDTKIPDLGSSRDRLHTVLAEIEEAAARARAYRPPDRKT